MASAALRFLVTVFLVLAVANADALARPITATWDANADGTTIGYRLYYGPAPNQYTMQLDVGNVTSQRLDVPPGGTYFFVVRAYNSSGMLSAPSNEVAVSLTNNAPTVFNPGDLTIPSGPINVQLPAWDPDSDRLAFSATGLPPSVTINSSTGLLSGFLSPGVYTVTLRVTDGDLSGESTFRLTVAGTTCGGPPGAARLNAAGVAGNHVTLSWTGAIDGPAATHYELEVGSAPTQRNIVVVQLPVVLGTVSTSAPNGVYFARLKARNGCGESTSNEISFSVGGATLPAPSLTFERSGATVLLSWTSPATGTPTSYVIEVGAVRGAATILFDTRSTATTFSTTAPPGTYYVRVRAVNSSGVGAPSNEVMIQVP